MWGCVQLLFFVASEMVVSAHTVLTGGCGAVVSPTVYSGPLLVSSNGKCHNVKECYEKISESPQ